MACVCVWVGGSACVCVCVRARARECAAQVAPEQLGYDGAVQACMEALQASDGGGG